MPAANIKFLWVRRLEAGLCFLFRITSGSNLPLIGTLTPSDRSYATRNSFMVISPPLYTTSKRSPFFASTYAFFWNDLPQEIGPSTKVNDYGFSIAQLGGQCFVSEVADRSPAAAAALLKGDLVICINGEPTQGKTLDEIVEIVNKHEKEVRLLVCQPLEKYHLDANHICLTENSDFVVTFNCPFSPPGPNSIIARTKPLPSPAESLLLRSDLATASAISERLCSEVQYS
nr:unnamed protein product [Spirometra erinaceieuropaei]